MNFSNASFSVSNMTAQLLLSIIYGTFPCAVFTQLERLDFTGKKVIAVMTHEGSGLGSCERDLKNICKGAAFGKGIAVHGADAAKSESSVSKWAKQVIG